MRARLADKRPVKKVECSFTPNDGEAPFAYLVEHVKPHESTDTTATDKQD